MRAPASRRLPHRADDALRPDVNQGDAATKDGLGATFLLDITDIARGVDGNTLTLRNNLKEAARRLWRPGR